MNISVNLNLKAISYGVLIDIISSNILGAVVFSTIYINIVGFDNLMTKISKGETISETAHNMEAVIASTPYMLIIGLIVGLICTLIGAFVASRVAKQSELLHGGLVGGIGTTLGLLVVYFLPDSTKFYPLFCKIISIVVPIPIGVIGGYLAQMTMQKNEITKKARIPRSENGDEWRF